MPIELTNSRTGRMILIAVGVGGALVLNAPYTVKSFVICQLEALFEV